MSIGKFSVENRVLVNILMVALLIIGAFSLYRMPQEQFAEVPFFWVNILVPVPGFSSEDIEKQVLIPIERAMQGLDSLKQIQSTAQEGLGVVRVEFSDGIDEDEFQRLFQDTRTRFSRVELPDDALQPLLDDFSSNDFLPVIEIVLHGMVDFGLLKDTAERLEDELLTIPEVSGIEIIGDRERQVLIAADRGKIEALGMSLEEIVRSVQGKNVNLPAGDVTTEHYQYLVRTNSEATDLESFRNAIVRRSADGSGIVHVGDIARVEQRFDPDGVRARYGGEQALFLRVLKVPKGDSIGIISRVREITDERSGRLPSGISVDLLNDSTIQIRESIDVLVGNALMGLGLLVIILFIFIGLRNSLMTALGIPVTFAITFLILQSLGETLNGNTLFGLVLVLGLIVDHAIVITENSYRLRQQGLSRRDAAILGSDQVTVPVIAATATTIAAFIPLMLLPGTIGKFLRVIPLTVTVALAASTFEAIVFLPAHFAEWPGGKKLKDESRILIAFREGFGRILDGVYRHRGVFIAVVLVIMIASFALVGFLQQDLFSGEDYTYFFIDIELPPGSPLSKTIDVVERFEEKLLPLVGNGEVAGASFYVGFQTGSSGSTAKNNVAQITVDLNEREEGRVRSIAVIMEEIRLLCATIPGPDQVFYRKQQSGPPVDAPISFRLFGDSYDELLTVSAGIRERLADYPELFNITDNYDPGTPEIRVRVNEERAATYGLSAAQIGSYLRLAVDGVTATSFFQDNREIDVMVTFARDYQLTPTGLERFLLPTPDGRSIPFSAVCTVEYVTAPAAVKRVDGKREITITAEAYTEENIQEINREIEEYYARTYDLRYPGVNLVTGGEFAEFANLLIQILQIFMVGVFLIYIILGTQFKSYTQPLLILFSVPLAFVGVILFLYITDTPFSTTVLYAAVALAGIAVNDAIVLISFINELRSEGTPVGEAVRTAARTRFRPILLTSLTTIAGLLPTAVGLGGESPVWGPMAGTIIFGLIFSTITALFFVPSLYGVLYDGKSIVTNDEELV